MALCPVRRGEFGHGSHVLRTLADTPPWCAIPKAEEPFTIGVYLPSIGSPINPEVSVPGQVLLLFKSYVAVSRSDESPPKPQRIPIGTVEFIESGALLCERWFSIITIHATNRFQYVVGDEACIDMFLYDLRRRLMTARANIGLVQGISCGSALELKFACAEATELDPDESILIRFFSPHVRSVERHHWFLHRDLRLPADYLGLTTRRILWLSDSYNGQAATGGIIARSCSVGRVMRLRMERGMSGWNLRVCFASASPWQIPLAKGLAVPACRFMEVFRASERFSDQRTDESQADPAQKLA